MDILVKDVWLSIFGYFELETMIIMRSVSKQFNQLLLMNIRIKLKEISGFNTEPLELNLLINLCKIHVIKSNVFAGNDRSFITTDERTFCTTLNQVFIFGNINIPKLLKNIYDVKHIEMTNDDTIFLFDGGEVKIFYKSDLREDDYYRSLENIKQISICNNSLLLLDNDNVYFCGLNKNRKLNLTRRDDIVYNNMNKINEFNSVF